MTVADLAFLTSALLVLALIVSIAGSAVMRRFKTTKRLTWVFAALVAVYAAVLISTALASPRRVFAPGEVRCFDDWCVSAQDVKPGGGPCQGRTWIATLEVSSAAKRVRQRASDARAELEDQQGNRYRPCAAPLDGKMLTDELGPGDSFRVLLPFQLPDHAEPAGIVLHHGDFPGVVIIGDDSSFLHPRALLRLGPAQ